MRNFPAKDKTFREFLIEVKYRTVLAFENQDVHLEDLVNSLNIKRDPARNPFFDVKLVVQNFDFNFDEMEELIIKPFHVENKTSKFDLSFDVFEAENVISVFVEYNNLLFKNETIKLLMDYFEQIVHSVVKNREVTIKDIHIENDLHFYKSKLIDEVKSDFNF
jgi:tyrocidine synthetase-3